MKQDTALIVIILLTLLNSCFSVSSNEGSPRVNLMEIDSVSSVTTILDFKIQKQSALSLCWAAVASSVSTYYQPNSIYTQCFLADRLQGRNDCCSNLNLCDKPNALDNALSISANLVERKNAPLSIDVIKNEIINGNPVPVRILWNSNNQGHFIVITGFHDDNTIDIVDPWPTYNPGRLSLIQLEMFYRDIGMITHYYRVKR